MDCETEKKIVKLIDLSSYAIYNEVCPVKYDKPITYANRITDVFFNKPLKEVLTNLTEMYDMTNVERLDISNNYLTASGAINLIVFAEKNMPNLEILDMSNNNINNSCSEFKHLSFIITELLKKANFKFLLLKGNLAFCEREKLIYNPNEGLVKKIPTNIDEPSQWEKENISNIFK